MAPAAISSPKPPELPVPNARVAGKYEIVRAVGEGGMAVVFEARHARLRQRVAVKVLHPTLAREAELVVRFEREARAAAQLQSINTARVIDVDVLPNGLPFMVLEFLEGHDLAAEIAQRGALPVEVAVDYVLQTANAMVEAHARGIVHRDLKPSNLFVCEAASTGRTIIKVLDFGISKVAGEGMKRITATSAHLGTPEYMSPEHVRAPSDVDARSDVWSLGVILFELLTGRTPFEGPATAVIAAVMMDAVPPPNALRGDVPEPLARAVLRMLEKDRERRVQTMAEVVQMLAPFAPASRAASPEAARPPGARLGDILVADGLLGEAELARALDEQRRTGQLLGRTLVDLGLVTEADLLVALAKQQGLAPAPRRRGRLAAIAVLGVAASVALAAGGVALARASGAARPPTTTPPVGIVTLAATPRADATLAPALPPLPAATAEITGPPPPTRALPTYVSPALPPPPRARFDPTSI